VKLVDFGIGKVLGRPGDAQDLTQDGVFVGTPRYMAPEQFEGNAFPASDYYALGTILFQALAGRLPFVGSTMSEFMVAKLARAVPTVREVAPDAQVPDSLEALIQHLLARNPDERPTLEQYQSHLMACEEEVFGTPHSMRRGNSSGPHSFATGSGPYAMQATGSGPALMGATGSGPAVLGATGSGPALPHVTGSVPHLLGAAPTGHHHPDHLRVPPTMVHPIPGYAQMTPRPMAAPAPPPEVAKPARAPIFLALLTVAAIGIGAGIYWTTTHPHGGGASLTSSTASAGDLNGTNGANGANGVNAGNAAFTLTIDSAPPGATVTEGENVLGETPLNVAIDRASVSTTPRTFVVTKDGFSPSHLVQGPSPNNVRAVVPLAPASAAGVDAASSAKPRTPPTAKPVAQTGGPATATKPTATAATTATGPGLDIRLKR